jgi:hypothetical protein
MCSLIPPRHQTIRLLDAAGEMRGIEPGRSPPAALRFAQLTAEPEPRSRYRTGPDIRAGDEGHRGPRLDSGISEP